MSTFYALVSGVGTHWTGIPADPYSTTAYVDANSGEDLSEITFVVAATPESFGRIGTTAWAGVTTAPIPFSDPVRSGLCAGYNPGSGTVTSPWIVEIPATPYTVTIRYGSTGAMTWDLNGVTQSTGLALPSGVWSDVQATPRVFFHLGSLDNVFTGDRTFSDTFGRADSTYNDGLGVADTGQIWKYRPPPAPALLTAAWDHFAGATGYLTVGLTSVYIGQGVTAHIDWADGLGVQAMPATVAADKTITIAYTYATAYVSDDLTVSTVTNSDGNSSGAAISVEVPRPRPTLALDWGTAADPLDPTQARFAATATVTPTEHSPPVPGVSYTTLHWSFSNDSTGFDAATFGPVTHFFDTTGVAGNYLDIVGTTGFIGHATVNGFVEKGGRPPLAHRQRRDGTGTAGPQLAHIGTAGGRPPLAWRQNNP